MCKRIDERILINSIIGADSARRASGHTEQHQKLTAETTIYKNCYTMVKTY